MKVKSLSLKENACIDYQLLEDIANPAQFVLYEIWVSKEDHALQFTKDYILEFGALASEILNKPYLYVFGKML